MGTHSVSGLTASGSSPESITLTAPSTAGTYYYGACVDSVTSESDMTNNCSAAVTVVVGAAPLPDLVVDTLTVDASAPAAGASFTLSATVRNEGNGSSNSTTLRYYRSTDATISASDTQVGTDAVGALSASGTSAESIDLTAPSSTGTYYYGACVDIVTGESDPFNNCSPAVTVTVGAAPAPDLVVDMPAVSESSPTTGASFTLSATVRNQGNGTSAFTTLRYYRSSDSTITTGDKEVGTDSVSRLDASGSGDQSISLTAPSSPGTYYYGACVDSVTGESDTSDNCSSAVTVTVASGNTYGVGDLLPGVPTTGLFIPAVTVGASLSSSGGDTTITFTNGGYIELQDGTRYTCQSTGGCGVHNGEVTQGTIVSQTTSVLTSDLIVDPPTVSEGAPAAGARFTLSATVRNQGSGSADSTTLRYYRSTDATMTTSDTSVGTDSVSGLNASGSSPESITLTAPTSPGTYYYGACVDSVSDESNTENNCSPAGTVTVGAAPAPDLVVDRPTVSESAPAAGARFTLSATVRNQGNGPSARSDTLLSNIYVEGLSPSGSSAKWVYLTAPSTAGTYYYGACVDSVTGEGDTTNNCSVAVTVVVGAAPALDLVVDTLTVSDSSPTAGASLTLSAKVHNQGSGRSASTTLRYYQSTDSTITTGDTSVDTDSVSELSSSWSSPQSISLTAPSTPGTYYYGACVDAVTGESDTTNNCSVAVTVVVSAAPTPAPDLVVDTPTVSDSSPTAGAFFTLNVTVRNRGNRPSATTTLKYWRETVTESSIGGFREVGTDTVDTLAASGASNMSISLTAPATPGMYNFYVSVNPVPGESNTNNNHSYVVRITVQSAMKPGAPTGLSATADGQTEIDLSWTAPSDDGGTNITGYKIEVSTDGSLWSDLEANTRSTSTTYSHTGLTAGSTRYYRVLAINVAGTGTASNTDSATTNSPPNRAPVAVGTIPDWTSAISGWEYLDVSSYFSDPDDDALSYSAVSSDTAVVISDGVSVSWVLIRAYSSGTARVTVTARDPGGLEATQTIAVRVNDRPEAVGTIPGQTIEVGQTITVDVSPYFRDPNEDLLAYEAVAGDALMVSVSGSTVSITGVSMAFVTRVAVTVRDPYGLSTSQQITMGVRTAVANPVPNDITLRLNTCFVFQDQHFVMFEVKARVSVSSLVVKTYQIEGRNNKKHLMESIDVGNLAAGSSYTKLTTRYFPGHLRQYLTTCTADANWDSGTLTPGFLLPTTAVPDLPPPSPPDTPIPQERLVPTQGQVAQLWISLGGTPYISCGLSGYPPCPGQDHIAYWYSLPTYIQRCAFERCDFD